MLITLFEGRDFLDIAELLEASRRYKLAYSSLNSLISYFDGSFLRVSETTLMSIEALNITEEDIALIRCHARDQYAASGYRALNNIKDYTSYPDLGLQWNLFLLRSLLQRYDDVLFTEDFGIFADENPVPGGDYFLCHFAIGLNLSITPQAIFSPDSPEGCVVKSSTPEWIIIVLPRMSLKLNLAV